MEYELYHDESKKDGYWHGMLLIPIQSKCRLVELLEISRNNIGYKRPFSMKDITSKTGKKYQLAESWIQIASASLISRLKKPGFSYWLGEFDKETKNRIYLKMEKKIGAKFILFCERDCLKNMEGYPDHASKVETTFRMRLKGGLHYLGSEKEPIMIIKLHFDGHEHYKRRVDKNRIIERMTGMRNYCSFGNLNNIIDDRTSNHDNKDAQSYDDCQLLQLTDIIIGGFRNALSAKVTKERRMLSKPFEELIQRYLLGYVRMRNSRWLNAFCLSECYLESGKWIFGTLTKQTEALGKQLPLFNF
jgi:hypothetical protein